MKVLCPYNYVNLGPDRIKEITKNYIRTTFNVILAKMWT